MHPDVQPAVFHFDADVILQVVVNADHNGIVVAGDDAGPSRAARRYLREPGEVRV
jgi:hypothetical protein